MKQSPPPANSFPADQFRMTRLQVFNWGTFTGLHEIPISSRGFLFVGRSGAGKSTLLDAFSALLVPPRWIDFNAAAREAERSGRDRSLTTYIRGAWAEQKDGESGEIIARHLRPGTTWSALGLNYKSESGKHITLVRLFWIRGNTSDVKSHNFIFERSFHLNEMEAFGEIGLDIRKLKQAFPDNFERDAFDRSDFKPYCDRLCSMLGIESEMALRLLHKTQSAKNLGDLNTFLRDFMLDKPETFEVADRLVSEFDELNAAHQAVVTARRQVETLSPARQSSQERDVLLIKKNELHEIRLGIDHFKDLRKKDLLVESLSTLSVKAQGLDGQVSQQRDIVDNYQSDINDLRTQHNRIGGGQIDNLENEKSLLGKQKSQKLETSRIAENVCRKLGWSMPQSSQGLAEMVEKSRHEAEGWRLKTTEFDEKRDNLKSKQGDQIKEFASIRVETEALRRQSSNIPGHMLDLRREIAFSIGLSESALPFAGELIEVRSSESPWQGAIERLLRGFSLSLLVDDRNYAALTNYLNGNSIGRNRLVYYRTNRDVNSNHRPLSSQSVFLKLNIKEDSPHVEWLQQELRQRFDYACADSLQAFRTLDKAITKEGQIKHSKARHEKDDRFQINDRAQWCLGFDNLEKKKLFEEKAQKLADEMSKTSSSLEALKLESDKQGQRAMDCKELVNIKWQDIDISAILDRISSIEKSILIHKNENTALNSIIEEIDKKELLKKTADNLLISLSSQLLKANEEMESAASKISFINENLISPTQLQEKSLSERFDATGKTITLDNLDPISTAVERGLRDEIEELDKGIFTCKQKIEKCFSDFTATWPAESEGLDPSIASALDFFAKLERLESDGLPAYEQRFFELLQNQSHQNLTALSTYLNDARKAIHERISLVNDSLKQVPFNQTIQQETYLHIEAKDRLLEEVTLFRQDILHAISNAWSNDTELAEARFITLQNLVKRLSSQENDMRRWRESVLDVRLHVEFIGQEIDEGGVIVEVYRSGAGKSGGQRQKLATTCLAAALRYQLGGSDRGYPQYAPVVLDEAFDKADNEFTALAMNIFANFGFQMIVATPLKSVMTLEPFIGGACFVDIADRRVSGVLMIEYDDVSQRLNLPDHARHGGDGEAS